MDTVPSTTSIILSLLVTITVILFIVHYYIESLRTVRLAKKLPGPPSVPILGHGLISLAVSPKDLLKIALEYAKQYGSVISVHLGTKVYIGLSDPQDVEIILSSSVHIDKSSEYRLFKPWLGDGLLITSGEKWRRHRKIIAPTFHMNILKTFVPLFYENSIDLVRRLNDKIGEQFDCHDYISAVTVDILTETAMGVDKERRQKTGHEYAVAVMEMSDITHRRHYDIRYYFDTLFKFTTLAKVQEKLLKTIHSLTDHVIKEKSKDVDEKLTASSTNDEQQNKTQNSVSTENLQTIENNNYTKLHYVRDDLDDIDENDVGEKKRLPFLENMLNLKKASQMTNEEITEEVNTIMFEGHDTTAAGSSFALCLLGAHQDIQARVHKELDAIFSDSDRPCTFQDTIEMKYLERVILEALRCFPPVPIIARKLKEDVKIVTGGYLLPKDATIVIIPFLIHRSEETYPNPTVFDPDNFLPEKMQQRHYYSFIPFSAGPRSCVGRKYAMLKLKVLLSTILRNYRVTSDISDKDFVLRADIILKRDDGFNIKIEPRKSASVNAI